MAASLAVLGSRARRGRAVDRAFRAAAASAAAALLAVLALMLFKLGQTSAPAWSQKGGELLTGTTWAPSRNQFGGLPFLYGTIVTSVIALVLAVPVGLATALFVSEFASRRVRSVVAPLTDLLAAVPSVIYGLWGFIVLVPTLLPFQNWLSKTLGRFIPIFAGPAPGVGYLMAGIVLAIMIIPTISAISREVFRAVPQEQRDAALALGATRWEAVKVSVLPAARPGVIGAIILGLGRALGETIAVTILIGNSPTISKSILSQGYTMPSVIANEFSEATSLLHKEALLAIGLMLFGVTLIVNILARVLIRRSTS